MEEHEEEEEEEEEEEKQEAIGEVFSRRVAGDVAAVAAQCVSNSHRPSPPSLTLLSSSSSSPDELEYLSYLGRVDGMVQCAANYLADQLFCHLCDAKSKVLNADGDDGRLFTRK